MTQNWKPGALAMVQIKSVAPGAGYAEVSFPGAASGYAVPVDCLSPLPPAMTAEDRAVIEAAGEQERIWSNAAYTTATRMTAGHRTNDAVRARAAKLAPPDPVEELIAAGNAFAVASRYCTDDAELAAAKARWVAAQEAARWKAP